MDRTIKPRKSKVSLSWLLKMTWRDSRRSRPKLVLFTASIVIGIAAFVGIHSFKNNLQNEIELQAKTLLGADLEVNTRHPWTEAQRQFLDSIEGDRSSQVRFASMIYFPRTHGTRLVQVRGLSGNYPYYGAIETEPTWASGDLSNGQYALVDERLMMQFDVILGDEIKVGDLSFEIRGKLRGVPGQTGVNASIAPIVYIPGRYLSETGLVKKGSRVTFSQYFEIPDEEQLKLAEDRLKERVEALELDYQTVASKKRNTSQAFKDLTVYLNLAAFIALLLGSIGVAGAVYIYLKDKNSSVAVLRCLGLKGRQAFQIYVIQVLIMGFIGAMVGSAVGVVAQFYLPGLLKEMLPVSITPVFYWQAPVFGLLLGLLITVLFALLPLISLSKVSPLLSIRQDFNQSNTKKLSWEVGSIFLILITFLYLFSYFQIGEWLQAAYFVGGLMVSFLLLFLTSQGLIWIAKKISKISKSYFLRQGISNLHRPTNQTTLMILSVGLCTTLLATIFILRIILVKSIEITGADDRPNMVLFDIQTHQKEEVKEMTLDYDLPVLQDVPVVTMRLREINGITKKDAEKDSTLDIPNWIFNREYRVTFRDSLISSETLADGALSPRVGQGDSIFVSISKGFAEGRGWKIGDELLWNVQGALIKTYIGSFRDIDWRRVQTNFLVLFPTGVLEKAPQFHVLVTKVDQSELSARYQQAVVRFFPNVSILDLELVLKTVEDVLSKISFVINFMAMLSVVTGIIVLISSVVMSRSQRIKESILLRTIGARSRQIIRINFIEYTALGLIAALSGIVLANLFSWLLARFVFEADYIFDFRFSAMITVVVIFATIIVGFSGLRSILNKSPLEILRRES